VSLSALHEAEASVANGIVGGLMSFAAGKSSPVAICVEVGHLPKHRDPSASRHNASHVLLSAKNLTSY
jgi:hypothetical protein